MLRLSGFVGSSYYNMVKLTLLEKGLAFEEARVALGERGKLVPDPSYREKSLIGKVPSPGTDRGFLSETNVIIDHLDDLGSPQAAHAALLDPGARLDLGGGIKRKRLRSVGPDDDCRWIARGPEDQTRAVAADTDAACPCTPSPRSSGLPRA